MSEKVNTFYAYFLQKSQYSRINSTSSLLYLCIEKVLPTSFGRSYLEDTLITKATKLHLIHRTEYTYTVISFLNNRGNTGCMR